MLASSWRGDEPEPYSGFVGYVGGRVGDVEEAGGAQRFGVVGGAGGGVGHPGEAPVQAAGDLDVEAGCAVFAGVVLGVVPPRPEGGQGAVSWSASCKAGPFSEPTRKPPRSAAARGPCWPQGTPRISTAWGSL